MDLINILEPLSVPTNAHLITLDIEGLYMYTNISQKDAIVPFLRKFKHHLEKVFFLDNLYDLNKHPRNP